VSPKHSSRAHKGHHLIAYGTWEGRSKLAQYTTQEVIHWRVFYADGYSPAVISLDHYAATLVPYS
jgi:hypothetical protein